MIRALVLLLFLVMSAPAAAQATGAPATLFTNVRVFDGKSGTVSGPAHVLVQGNRIARISPAPITPPPGAVVIDGQGRTLMPGLIDVHWHAMLVRPTPAQAMTADVGYSNLLAGAEAREAELALQAADDAPHDRVLLALDRRQLDGLRHGRGRGGLGRGLGRGLGAGRARAGLPSELAAAQRGRAIVGLRPETDPRLRRLGQAIGRGAQAQLDAEVDQELVGDRRRRRRGLGLRRGAGDELHRLARRGLRAQQQRVCGQRRRLGQDLFHGARRDRAPEGGERIVPEHGGGRRSSVRERRGRRGRDRRVIAGF